jgi:hypothetical protein
MSQPEPERTSTFHFSSEELIRSCPLPESLYSHKSRTYKTLTIEASKIEPLSSFLKHNNNNRHLEYSDMERLIEMIGRQLYHLEVEQNKGISMFHLDDITVFHSKDDVYFSITNEENIHDIDDENQIELTIPSSSSSISHPRYTSKNIAFYSPEYKEFISKKTLPYAIHFKSSYYSFGLLCVYCYVSRDTATATATATATHDDDHDPDFETLVAPIIHTKIYWFLKHVLRKIPTERRYICV